MGRQRLVPSTVIGCIVTATVQKALWLFERVEAGLERGKGPWLVMGPLPTIADIALYTYTARAPECGVPLDGYTAMSRWIERVEGLPRIPDGHMCRRLVSGAGFKNSIAIAVQAMESGAAAVCKSWMAKDAYRPVNSTICAAQISIREPSSTTRDAAAPY